MKKHIVIASILLMLFVLVTTLVVTNNISNFDDTIYNALMSIRSNYLDIFFKTITKCGNTITVIVIIVVLFIFIREKYRLMLVSAPFTTVLSNQILKHIIMRPRPDHLRLISQDGYSYPSGHAMISIALYGFLIYYVYKKINNKYLKIFLISLLSVLIILIGISRIYVGVHYPSDIIGGYILSLLILILVILGVDKYVKNGSK